MPGRSWSYSALRETPCPPGASAVWGSKRQRFSHRSIPRPHPFGLPGQDRGFEADAAGFLDDPKEPQPAGPGRGAAGRLARLVRGPAEHRYRGNIGRRRLQHQPLLMQHRGGGGGCLLGADGFHHDAQDCDQHRRAQHRPKGAATQSRRQAQSAFSIASALDTSNWPGCSTFSALTTPSSTSIE